MMEDKPYFDLSKLKVGDRLWDFVYGWGSVVKLTPGDHYPIIMEFEGKPIHRRISFLATGAEAEHRNQSLFYDEIKFTPPPRPKRMVTKEKWIAFWRDRDGRLSIVGYADGGSFFTPTWFSSYEDVKERPGGMTPLHKKNIPLPVRVVWEEEEE